MVYYKHKYKHGIRMLSSNSRYCMWIRLNGQLFGYERDLFMGIVYIRPADAKTRDQYFEELENDILKYEALGDVLMSGDFNARTGTEPDYIVNDESLASYVTMPSSYVADIPYARNNQDKVCNEYGKLLLELCSSHSMRILNGRFIGDTQGHLTFYSHNGASCVDYTLVSVNVLDRITYFSIAEPDYIMSDHCLQRVGLRCAFNENIVTQVLHPMYDKFEWVENGKHLYPLALLNEDSQSMLCEFLYLC